MFWKFMTVLSPTRGNALYPNKDIKIKTYDLDLENPVFYTAYDAGAMDEEADFMEDEAIEKTVKYMKEHIK